MMLLEKLTFRGGFTPVNPPEGKQAYVTDAAITQTPPATTVYTKRPARVALFPLGDRYNEGERHFPSASITRAR